MTDSFPVPPGLCTSCRHVRIVTTRSGAAFVLCRLAETDMRFSRYPVLPVRHCPGYEARQDATTE